MSTHLTDPKEIPRGNSEGFVKYFKQDFISGFLVFLIALPLCLGISVASGFPPIAGIFTAIVGSVVATFLSNSELTIKGPAAGMIVIVVGCVEAFGGDGTFDLSNSIDVGAYRAALAVGVVAAVLQVFFGIFRAGILGEFFPISAVHGMLAAIGVIIIAKQVPVALGVTATGGPLELLKQIPQFIAEANPAIAAIGVTSVLIMFSWPLVQRKVAWLRKLPSPLIVLLVAVPMGMGFDLMHERSYVLQNHQYQLGETYLVAIRPEMFGMFQSLTTPDFMALTQPKAWTWVLMFFIIGSLESLLSAKAVDLLDPWKRKSNMDRDMIAVGTGNLCVSMIGGLPMISEIVRSRANIDNGAQTRFANFWHGMLLLVCVAFIPMVLHRIPMAALAAMLIYTGFRLAHPSEFRNVWKIGREQLVIFVVTLVSVLATDLLIGIAVGIATKVLIHLMNGVPVRSLFRPEIELTEDDGNTVRLTARQSAVFSNWIPMRRQIERFGLVDRRNVVLDLADVHLVDHTVMDKLHELESDFEVQGLSLTTIGLESHQSFTNHVHSTRRKGVTIAKLLTITVHPEIEQMIVTEVVRRGASGYTVIPCRGAGRHEILNDGGRAQPRVRIEVIIPNEWSQSIVDYLVREVQPDHRLTFAIEAVQVARLDAFTPTAKLDAPIETNDAEGSQAGAASVR